MTFLVESKPTSEIVSVTLTLDRKSAQYLTVLLGQIIVNDATRQVVETIYDALYSSLEMTSPDLPSLLAELNVSPTNVWRLNND